MSFKDYTSILPEQYTGQEIVAEAYEVLPNTNEAISQYEIPKNQLLTCNRGHQVAGTFSASFQIVNAAGREVTKKVQRGDFLKIDIPGPGSKAGGGYDWVQVEEVKEMSDTDMQSTAFRVRPTANPTNNTKDMAHFYYVSATSNFIVTREGPKLTAIIVDRDTKPNDDAHSAIDKIRDAVVGTGALASFSKIQWQNLAEGTVRAY